MNTPTVRMVAVAVAALAVGAAWWLLRERDSDQPAAPISEPPRPGPIAAVPIPPQPRAAEIPVPQLADAGSPPAQELVRAHALTRAGLVDAMESAMPDIERCYDDWLRLEAGLEGRVNVELTIDPKGRVTKVSTGGKGTGNVAFEGCALATISTLQFEGTGAPTTLSWPLMFVAPPTAPDALKPVLMDLCRRLRTEAGQPEHAKVQPDELLTVVLENLERQTPDLKTFTAVLLPPDVPPLQRRRAFERGISKALGEPWDCPAFGNLWDGVKPAERDSR